MNNENNSQVTETNSVTQTPNSNTAADFTPPPKQPRSWRKILLALALSIIVLLLVAGAYYLGTKSSDSTTANTEAVTQTPTNTSADELPDEDQAPVADPYAGWKTYTNPTYGYSFKYPADWQVDRRIVQEPSDWVSINPAGKENPGTDDVLAITTYADGVGCEQTTTREFMIGDTTVEGVACAGDEIYSVSMKHAKVARAHGSGENRHVILARAAPDLAVVKINTSRGEDETINLILKSIVGLSLYNN